MPTPSGDWPISTARRSGIPEEVDHVRRYRQRVGRHAQSLWTFYLAFSFFRIAAILQEVRSRARSGQARSADFAHVGTNAAPLAEIH